MLKVQFKKFGKPEEQLYLKEVKINTQLRPTEVLIEVLFFPINPADLLLVEGKYGTVKPNLPTTLGAECVAKVIKIGNQVNKIKINDIVIPLTRNNWSEKLKIDELNLIKINNKINLLQASMLKVNPATAYLMLNNYVTLRENDLVLQNAANSGVGNYIIQLAKFYKIKTINIVRRKTLISDLKKKGAYKVILDKDYNSLKKSSIKLFIDAVGGKNVDFWASYINEHGTVLNYGLLSDENIQINSSKIIFKNITIKGFWLTLWLEKMIYKEKVKLYKHLSELIIKKVLYTDIENIFHISEIKKAVLRANRYKRSGKILVAFNKNLIKNYL